MTRPVAAALASRDRKAAEGLAVAADRVYQAWHRDLPEAPHLHTAISLLSDALDHYRAADPADEALRLLRRFMDDEVGWSRDRAHYRWNGPNQEWMREARAYLAAHPAPEEPE